MLRDPDGNSTISDCTGGSSPIAQEETSKMAWTSPELPQNIPPRPTLTSQQSNSLPSTPYQHARDLPFDSRSPSPSRAGFNTSPRSSHSESYRPPLSVRKTLNGCPYETGLAHFRRRMPYSLGGDKLDAKKGALKTVLEPDEDKKLSGDMRELYDRLLPSPESDERRAKFVRKLEKLMNDQWPGNNIKVHVFGSSGNKLCTSNSDVDICITTTFKELEHVCLLAALFAKRGMERVVCVSHAKVPIVKIWDPELELACDMNVNNPMALENTRMIKTYVEIDDRVRPLAMIIKHWTKRRILNDAALGGTLSSYTWICMIIFFLQRRNPPVLPVLQQRPHPDRKTPDGTNIGFDDDIEALRGFGAENKESLGELLFQFFRYYGHEIDYETSVISIRQGALISKEEKGWHLLQNNRLCVEEPFNASRNLGNTADDTSFRGIHLELRRAFELVMEGRLESCANEYEYPIEEEKIFERPPPPPRPTLTQTLPQAAKGARQGGKGNRNPSNSYSRGSNSNRRSSNGSSSRNNPYSNANAAQTARELLLQQRHQQFLLHDHLYQQIQVLQAQEHELRIQLALQGRHHPQILRQSFPQFPSHLQEQLHDENSRARSRTLNQPPLTAPLHQQVFQYPPQYVPMTVPLPQGTNTNPPSPMLTPAVPDLRRSHRRSSVTTGSNGGSLRAQSQPARPVPSPLSFQSFAPLQRNAPESEQQRGRPHARPAVSPSRTPVNGDIPVFQGQIPAVQRSPYADDSRSSGYVGYYLGGSPPVQQYRYNPAMASLPSPYSLPIVNGLVHPCAPHLSAQGRSPTVSPPSEEHFDVQSSGPLSEGSTSQSAREFRPQAYSTEDRGPLVVDGSASGLDPRQATQSDSGDQAPAMSISTSASGDQVCYTPVTGSDSLSLSQDLQDVDTRDLDYSPFHAQSEFQGRDALGIANGLPANQPSIIQRPRIGSLPPHLLPIRTHPSEQVEEQGPSLVNGTSEPSMEAFSERQTGDMPEPTRSKVESLSSHEHASVLAQLSPVEEIRTPSPTVRRRPDALDLLKMNGNVSIVSERLDSGARPTLSPSFPNGKQTLADISLKKVNGVAPVTRSQVSPTLPTSAGNGWVTTTTKRKNKKRTSSSFDAAANPIGGEHLPLNEAERKGG